MFKKLTLTILGLALLFAVRPVFAQMEGQGLTISPPILEINLEPGNVYNQIIKVTNPTKNLVEVYPVVMNFTAKDETGSPGFSPASDESQTYAMAKWITFSQNKLALTSQQVVEFKYTIKVPADAEPGGHYGVVFFASQPPKLTGDISQVAIASQVGSLVLGRVAGEISEQGAVEAFSVAKKFYFKPPVDLIARIKNNGNVHFKPTGDISIKNMFGSDIGKVTVNDSKGNVLPQSIRKFEQKWDPATSPFYKIPIGRFTANLALAYGEINQPLSATVSFWVIPIWFIVVVAAVIILIIALIIWQRKKKGGSGSTSEPEILDEESEKEE